MDDIIEPTIDYDFSKLYLGPPTTLAGGAYFTRLMYNTNKQLFIQTPKSLTKQGFIKSGKKVYTDLMFDNNDTVFINWIENLETKCQDLIFSKGQNWFETKLEKDDIESAFTSPFKIFKSGKYYLLRVNVKQNIKIYDEKDQIINGDDIDSAKTIISILEIQGIKFTSRNFQIEIELKQAMVVSPDPFLDECFIKKPIKKQPVKEVTIIDEPEIKEEISNLEEFINDSANDLAKTLTQVPLEKTKLVNNDSIDLEVQFDEPVKQYKLDNQGDNQGDKQRDNQRDNQIELEEANIVLDIENLETDEIKEDPNILTEVDLSSTLEDNLETITLKKPNQVYYEIYQKAREKAKEAKKNAIVAFLEMKNIKKTYMLNDIDESDSEFEDFASADNASEVSDAESLEDTF
jgi:hypothetical protein